MSTLTQDSKLLCVCEDVRLLLKVHSADFHLCVYSSFMFPDGRHDSAHISIVLTQVRKQTHRAAGTSGAGYHGDASMPVVTMETVSVSVCSVSTRLKEFSPLLKTPYKRVLARACPAHCFESFLHV